MIYLSHDSYESVIHLSHDSSESEIYLSQWYIWVSDSSAAVWND